MEILIKEIAANPVTKNEDSAPGASTSLWLQHNQKKKNTFPANCAGISTVVIHITPSIHQQSTHVRMNMAFVYLAYIKRWNDISGKNPCLSGLWKHFQFHFHFTRF